MNHSRTQRLFPLITLIILLTSILYEGASAQEIYIPMVRADAHPAPPSTDEARPPANFSELIYANVDANVWTEGEGIRQTLQFFVGERKLVDLPGGATVTVGEGTGVDAMAAAYLQDGVDQSLVAEIDRLLSLVVPAKANLDYYSAPEPSEQLASASVTGTVPSAQDCEQLWVQGLPTDLPAPGPCHFYAERKVFGSEPITLRVYHPVSWQNDPALTPYFRGAIDALEKSTLKYQQYGEMKNITLVFAPIPADHRDSFAAAFSTAIKKYGYDSCPIVMYRGAELPLAKFKQAVAHEVFHCYQGLNLSKQMEPDSIMNGWWVEGTASFFSNVVYPDANLEHDWHDSFNKNSAAVSLMDMTYENSIFFQYLANKFSAAWIATVLLPDMPTASGSTIVDQARSLAKHEVDFHQFGKDFLDGTIVDSNGTRLRTDELPLILSGKEKEFRYTKKGDKTVRNAYVFTLRRNKLIYDEKKEFTQNVVLKSATHSVKRFPLPGQPWTSLEERAPLSCGRPTEILLLVTSADVDARNKNDHFTNEITNVEPRQCTCYFEASFGGAQAGYYRGPAYLTQNGSQLQVQALPPFDLWTANFTAALPVDTNGDTALTGFSLGDNAIGLILGMTDGGFSGGTVTISKSTEERVEGKIEASLIDLGVGSNGGPVNMSVGFAAVRPISAAAELCDTEWGSP